MNIVLYNMSFLPTVGGREVVLHYLATHLRRQGHRVRVVGPAGMWSQSKIHMEHSVHRWPSTRELFTDQLKYLELFLDTAIWKCDVIHAHSTYPCGYIAGKLKSLRNIPLVVTPHGEDINVIPEIGFGKRLDPVIGPKIEFALQKSELVTAISDTIEASLLEAKASPDKIRRVRNGIDLERFRCPLGLDVRAWLGVREDARLILSVGNYHPRKGHEVVIRAMRQVLQAEPRACLVLVGANMDTLMPLIQSLGIGDSVRLTGSISFPAVFSNGQRSGGGLNSVDWLAAIYQASEAYVSAGISEGSEGLSLAVLDAMAAGLPVVATDISGNRDIVRNEENGLLVCPSDGPAIGGAIVRILETGDWVSRLSLNASKTVEDYHWAAITRQYVEVYEEARDLSTRRGRRWG